MNECREFESLIDRVQTGEASEEEREALIDHLESCVACSDVFDALGRLRDTNHCPEPAAGEFLSVRRSVIRELRNKKVRESGRGFSLVPFVVRPGAAIACALGMLILGFFLGSRLERIRTPNHARESPSDQDAFMETVRYVAKSHSGYEDIVNSPFTYTNVRVSRESAGMVNLSFDVSRHLNLMLRNDDPLLTEVLVQSLIEPSNVYTRLTAISMAGTQPDPKIKKSLIYAMLHDENLAVRMTAQSRLIEHHGDREIINSLLDVLERETSVQMRLIAINYLADSKIQPERLKRAVTAGRHDGREAVLIMANQYLNR